MEASRVERSSGSKLRGLAVLSAAGVSAFAFVTPARADDSPPPSPPLMVGTSAAIVPDEPDAVVDVTEPTPAPDPAPVKAVTIDGWELAAKPHHQRVVVRTHPAPVRVISSGVRPARRIQPHHAARPTRSVARPTHTRWYQAAPKQYRRTRAHAKSDVRGSPVEAAQDASLPIAGARPVDSEAAQNICELRARKCLHLCRSDAGSTVSQNQLWIRVCIYASYSTEALDEVQLLLLQRLWTVAAAAESFRAGRQYQRYARQYQSGASSEPPPAVVPAVRRHGRWRAEPVMHPARRHVARVLAAATRVQRPAKVATTSSPLVAAETSHGTEKLARRRDNPAGSGDWFLHSLLALVAIALLAFTLTALAELPRVGAAYTAVWARLVSKRLSGSRIDLGDAGSSAQHRPGGISYRD